MTTKPHLHKSYIDSRALAIIESLQAKDHITYLVGGCVRDLLIGIVPKDFDIGTFARPSQVKRCLPQAYIIGKRFRLVLAKRDDDFFEIATFRKEVPPSEKNEEYPNEDNTFGSPEQDALRRDFTINGLFYDPFKEELIDYCQGVKDLNKRMIRMIGDPTTRLQEDPIRILRAIRLAHKINFTLEPSLREAMEQTAESLYESALPRRREELLKFLRVKDPSLPFLESYDLGVLKVIAPTLHELFEDPETNKTFAACLRQLHEFDLNPSNPTELFAYVVHSYARIKIWPDPTKPLTNKQLEEHAKLKHLMRFELGMYNLEQEIALKSLKIQTHLQQAKEYKEQGKKRIFTVLKNSSFYCGLLFARIEGVVSDEDWAFWSDAYEKNLPELISQRSTFPRRRKKSSR